MRERIAVTGSGGYIGSVMVRGLLKSGYRVKAIDMYFFGKEPLAQYSDHPRLEIVRRDIRSVTPADFEGCDAVIDMAALSNDPSGDLDPELTKSINETGRIRVVNAAKQAGVRRYVFASSCAVYGAGQEMFLTEEAPLRPLTVYAQTCTRAEAAVLALSDRHFTATAMRNATVFGLSPRMRFDLVVNQMTLDAAKEGHLKIGGDGSQWRPFVHVGDVVGAFLKALRAPHDVVAGQVFNVGWDNRQILDVALAVKNLSPRPCSVEFLDSKADKRDYHVDFSKIRNVLNYEPSTSIEDGVVEIATALASGKLVESPSCYTVRWYARLMNEARNLLQAPLEEVADLAPIGAIVADAELREASAQAAMI
ncbi:NAD-dependent epimerase/dehydratase family protein [Methylobacterium brachythecii]|uniref:NAD-dependent dehydratase n=1 Tax=Methylobacterium brachythecii TaxID=1176177 RepID=A0ABQ6D489_9HYPH|nr:SDR family oxidoreductase [Methylobacterium brachythecii]GLS44749.1 NAD-dependent dehydratase [Methylobacterium brachythecii]